MKNLKLGSLLNVTTGGTYQAQSRNNRLTADHDISAVLSEFTKGDILQTPDGTLHYVILTEIITSMYRSFLGVTSLRASQTANIIRSGEPVASGVKCHASMFKLPDDELSAIIDKTCSSSRIHNQDKLITNLIDAVALIDDSKSDLQRTLQHEIDQHAGSVRIITATGSGSSIGDQIAVDGLPDATITSIDRKAFSGLDILICQPDVDPQPVTKPSILSRITGA